MTKAQFLTLCSQDYDEWNDSQEGQTDPYEYERSLDELMTRLGRRMLQMSVGEVPFDHRKKNDTHALRGD